MKRFLDKLAMSLVLITGVSTVLYVFAMTVEEVIGFPWVLIPAGIILVGGAWLLYREAD